MKYNRILLKLSGEALLGKNSYGIDNDRLVVYAKEIKQIHEQGVEIAIVIGGGNIFRGLTGSEDGIDRVQADYMGMLATVINGLALQKNGRAKLVGVSIIPPTGNKILDTFLGLPNEALAELQCEIK